MANPFPKPKLRILLVEDDADTRGLVTMMFADSGHKLLTTGHGKSALTLLEHEKVDIILLDIMMPELDGLKVLENVRRVSSAPILMLTALSDPRIMEESYLLGANDYLIKPFTKNKLFDRIDRLASQLTSFVDHDWSTRSGDFKIESEKNSVLYRGRTFEMTPNELKMITRLTENAYMEVSVFDLYEAVWGREPLPLRTKQALVDSTVNNLREKLEEDPQNPKIFLTSDKGCTFLP